MIPELIIGSREAELHKIPWFMSACRSMRIIFITTPTWLGTNLAMERPMTSGARPRWDGHLSGGSFPQGLEESPPDLEPAWPENESRTLAEDGERILPADMNRMRFGTPTSGSGEWRSAWGPTERFMAWIGAIPASAMTIPACIVRVEEFTNSFTVRTRLPICRLCRPLPMIPNLFCDIRMHGSSVNGCVSCTRENQSIPK